jgi:hypothetical protein
MRQKVPEDYAFELACAVDAGRISDRGAGALTARICFHSFSMRLRRCVGIVSRTVVVVFSLADISALPLWSRGFILDGQVVSRDWRHFRVLSVAEHKEKVNQHLRRFKRFS